MKKLRQIRSYNIGLGNTIPTGPTENELLQKQNVEKRHTEIINSLNYQFLQMAVAKSAGRTWRQIMYGEAGEKDIEVIASAGSVFFDQDGTESIKAAKELVYDLQNIPDLTQMEIGEVVYAEGLSEQYLTEVNLSNLKRLASIAGADGYKSLGIEFSVDGMNGVLLMDTARYNGRWYNLTGGGNIGAIYGLTALSGGMAIAYDDGTLAETRREVQIRMIETKAAVDEMRAEFESVSSSVSGSSYQNGLEELTGKPYSSLTEEEIDAAIESVLDTDLTIRDPRDSITSMTWDQLIDFFALSELQ